jgi:aarF domain-containing kinase
MKKIPSSLLWRGSKLALAASKIALNEVSSKLKSWETEKEKLENKLEAARALVSTLSELKGASMKLGQLLSLDISDFLPPEIVSVLETLHKDATFLPWSEIEKILVKELGPKLADFDSIEKLPLGSASIGQVHSAKLQGKDVVLKIQYPGVKETIPKDMKILSNILGQLVKIQKKEINFTPLMSELAEVLRLESDYRHELKMLLEYKKNFEGSMFVVPEVYQDYSTNSVLCMQRIHGKTLKEWMIKASQSEKNMMASQLISLYIKEFFDHGLVQTDPNPGNFLILSDNRIALLDFGATKVYSPDFIKGYKRLVLAAYKNNRPLLLEESYQLGFIDIREKEETKAIYCELIELVADLVKMDEEFDFKDKHFVKESQRLSWGLSQKAEFSPPPKDLIFLHRKLGGIFTINRRLEAKLKLRPYWENVFDGCLSKGT